MRFELLDLHVEPVGISPVCRIAALGIRWRVLVETYRAATGCAGRLIFEPDSPGTRHETRYGPLTLRGRSREDLLDRVHAMSMDRLTSLLHSLG